ncbi:hypothetical protein BDR26DRAFT_867764 [Obelidium mucronatum]|nr:hypothetical protein BDR26DRAFT_867764 [Obelidium mucronatum]
MHISYGLGAIFATVIASVQAQSTSCPFAAGSAPFASLTATTLNYAQNFKIAITPYTVTLTIDNTTTVLQACNAPTQTPGAITVPVSSVSINQEAVLGFIERLNKQSSISSIGSQYATSSCTQTKPTSGSSQITFGTTGINVSKAILSEQSPLAQGEWLVFFDAFYGFTGNSIQTFATIANQYKCLQGKVNSYKTAKAAIANALPIAVISAADLSTNTVVAPQNVKFWTTLIQDAGAVPLVASDSSSFQNLAHTADLIFDTTNEGTTSYDILLWNKIYGLNPQTQGYNFLNGFKSQIWRFDHIADEGHNDFYQSSPAQPELLLADVISVLSEKYFGVGFENKWTRNLANSAGYEQVTAACPATFTMHYNGVYCTDSNTFTPDFGRYYNPSGIPLTQTEVPTTTLAAGVVGGIVGGVLVGLALIAGAVWFIGRKRTLSGADKTGQSPFTWVKDAVSGRRFATLEEEDIISPANVPIKAVNTNRVVNGATGSVLLGEDSAGRV